MKARRGAPAAPGPGPGCGQREVAPLRAAQFRLVDPGEGATDARQHARGEGLHAFVRHHGIDEEGAGPRAVIAVHVEIRPRDRRQQGASAARPLPSSSR